MYSLKDHKLYKGYSSDPAKRFLKHNAGGNSSTKNRRPLVLIHLEVFKSKSDALDRERWSKTPAGIYHLKDHLRNIGILDQDNRILIE